MSLNTSSAPQPGVGEGEGVGDGVMVGVGVFVGVRVGVSVGVSVGVLVAVGKGVGVLVGVDVGVGDGVGALHPNKTQNTRTKNKVGLRNLNIFPPVTSVEHNCGSTNLSTAG